jgi:hypothetical protein|tara:strand:- start:4292 stop:6139 length:1848 start_codon:yes stop_codon:yes gene_type:complete
MERFKQYIKEATEKKKEYLAKNLNFSLRYVNAVDDRLGPSLAKYLEWVLKQIKNKNLEMEDVATTAGLLTRFNTFKNKKGWTAQKDINTYKTTTELFRAVSSYENENPEEEDVTKDPSKLKGNTRINTDESGETVWKLMDYEDFQIFNPKKYTEWCVAYPNEWEQHGPPFYMLNSNPTATLENPILLHLPTSQIRDEEDEMQPQKLSSFRNAGLDIEGMALKEIKSLSDVRKYMRNDLPIAITDDIITDRVKEILKTDEISPLTQVVWLESLYEEYDLEILPELEDTAKRAAESDGLTMAHLTAMLRISDKYDFGIYKIIEKRLPKILESIPLSKLDFRGLGLPKALESILTTATVAKISDATVSELNRLNVTMTPEIGDAIDARLEELMETATWDDLPKLQYIMTNNEFRAGGKEGRREGEDHSTYINRVLRPIQDKNTKTLIAKVFEMMENNNADSLYEQSTNLQGLPRLIQSLGLYTHLTQVQIIKMYDYVEYYNDRINLMKYWLGNSVKQGDLKYVEKALLDRAEDGDTLGQTVGGIVRDMHPFLDNRNGSKMATKFILDSLDGFWASEPSTREIRDLDGALYDYNMLAFNPDIQHAITKLRRSIQTTIEM